MSYIHRSHKLMDRISTYDSSSLVSSGLIRNDDNGTKWWLHCVTDTVSPPSYRFLNSRFSTLIMLSLHIPKNVIDIISFSHKSRILRFDYSKTFGGFLWLHFVLTAPPLPSQGALLHSALIPKSCLWEHKSIKFL